MKEKNEVLVKTLYSELVKLSSRVFIRINTLKDFEKALQRPFVFKEKQYDEDMMYREMKNLRLKILRKLPRLGGTNELKQFLMPTGDIGDIRKLHANQYQN